MEITYYIFFSNQQSLYIKKYVNLLIAKYYNAQGKAAVAAAAAAYDWLNKF